MVAGSTVTLSWTLDGEPSTLEIEGVDEKLETSATSHDVKVDADTDFVLRAHSDDGDDSETISVAVHAADETVSQHLSVDAPDSPAYVMQQGEDIYLVPPVRLWAQYDERWGSRRLGRSDSPKKDCRCGKQVERWHWHAAACSASSAAMVLRRPPASTRSPRWTARS